MATSRIAKRKRAKTWEKIKAMGFVAIGLGLTIAGLWIQFRTPSLSFGSGLAPSYHAYQSAFLSPAKIEIKAAGINLAVEETQIVNGEWITPQNSAGYLSSSGKPGQDNNIVIYGHNKGHIFAKLHLLSGGEVVVLTDPNGKKFVYKVVEKKVVKPDQISEVAPTTEEILTIYTCTGRFDADRLVIKAKPWEKVIEGLI